MVAAPAFHRGVSERRRVDGVGYAQAGAQSSCLRVRPGSPHGDRVR